MTTLLKHILENKAGLRVACLAAFVAFVVAPIGPIVTNASCDMLLLPPPVSDAAPVIVCMPGATPTMLQEERARDVVAS